MGAIGDMFKGMVGWVIASTTSFFKAAQDKISEFLPKSEDIEITASDYVKEHRLPEFDEVLTSHSPNVIKKVIALEKKMYNKLYLPNVDGIYNWALRPAKTTPETAQEASLEFLPIAAAATIGASVLDGTLEGLSGSKIAATGLGKIEALRHMDAKLWSRLGLGAATTLALQAPLRIGLLRNLDYYYNKSYRSQKLALPQAYDGVRFREFLTENEWAVFEDVIKLDKTIEEMTPEEIAAWAEKAATAVDAVEITNTARFRAALEWLGYKEEDITLQDRAAKHAPSLMMLRQMAMRGFFDAKFMARSIFKGGFDNWAIKPMLNFLAFMAQEGVWRGFREASQSAFVKGLIDEEELRSILRRIHVPQMLLDPIIQTQKLKLEHKERDLTTTQLLAAYVKGAISREEVFQELKSLGYTETTAEILIKTKEATIKPSDRMPTLTQFARAFREGIINEEDFRANLDKRGYSANHTDMLLDIERAKFPVVKPLMTMSSLGRAFREGIISETVMKQRLEDLGFSVKERDWIKLLYTAQPKIAAASLSKAEILKAVSLGIIDLQDGVDRLQQMGYPLEDIEILYKTYQKKALEIV